MMTATLDGFDYPSAAAFNIGDVVRLKSGGPRMTVTYVGPLALAEGEHLMCQWFDEHGELRQETFEHARVQIEPRQIPAASVQWRQANRFA